MGLQYRISYLIISRNLALFVHLGINLEYLELLKCVDKHFSSYNGWLNLFVIERNLFQVLEIASIMSLIYTWLTSFAPMHS
jgi:hypothetical protein